MKTIRRGNKIFIYCSAVILSLFIVPHLSAQSYLIDKAESEYNNYGYMEATKIYEMVVSSGYGSAEIYQRLGDSYYFNSRYDEAQKWYAELFSVADTVNLPKEYYLRYSQSLKSTESHDLAKIYYNHFLSMIEGNVDSELSAEMYLDLIEQNSGRYDLDTLKINKTNSIDFGASFYGDDAIIFSSNRDIGFKNKDKWSGLSFFNFYLSEKDSLGNLAEPIRLESRHVRMKDMHESSLSFTEDLSKVYFSRNNIDLADTKENEDLPLHLKIYLADVNNDERENIQDLPINGIDFSTAHPSLNAAGTKLYFVSDRPGGFGETDIYVVDILADGSFGEPKNLGIKINTPGRESFPFITPDNELYFSSDGHFGLGGYDVFYIKLDENDVPINKRVLNVGTPVNSPSDDVAYIVKNSKGYISTNRNSEDDVTEHYDNIYGFTENEPIRDVFVKSRIFGVVTDKKSGEAISDASITIVDEANVELTSLKTNESGYYERLVDFEVSYVLNAVKSGYVGEDSFSSKGSEDREHNFQLEKSGTPLVAGVDLASILNIKIYFDLDKHNIRPDAQVELEKLVVLLKEYPELKIDVRAHTDSRASDAYNLALSNRRAKSTVDYLITRGIETNRLSGKGYGESQLINSCDNDSNCSEEEHQENRRSEFIIVD